MLKLSKTQQRKLLSLEDKRILILGAGREGLSNYLFLRKVFPQKELTLADRIPQKNLNAQWKKIFAQDFRLKKQLGAENYLENLSAFDLIFLTPGIPPALDQLVKAKNLGVKFSSNTELFLKLVKGKTIGVTGTKGKSTTSSLIAHVLRQGGKKTQLVGNIGAPALDFLSQVDSKTYIVLEMSAQQLQALKQSPNYAVVQNITSEHLDYFNDNQAYIEAKTPICRFQKPKDFFIYSDEFKTSNYFSTLTKAKKLCFGLKNEPGHLAFTEGKAVFYRGKDESLPVSLAAIKKIKLMGKHNLYNIFPAILIAKSLKITNEQIESALYSFTPLRHRLEYACTVNDVSYYNDSLSTNPQAAIAALKVFAKKDIILMAGGYERHQDFTKFAQAILKYKVHVVILFPTTGKRIKKNIIDLAIKKKLLVPKFFSVNSMQEAVSLAHREAKPKDIVLLSPGAASFDIFKDYADRGDQFCQLAKSLLK